MAGAVANGYSDRRPSVGDKFEWQPTFDALLEQTATTNVVDSDWSILKDMIKHKLAETITNFLAMGPPWPLAPEDALQARERAYDTLDSFMGPPFTIQRLCELTLYPRRQYTSLPKYLRAVNRVLSVTSERSAFPEDDVDNAPLASTSATALDTTLGLVGQGLIHPPLPSSSTSASPIATRRPSASPSLSGSPRSSPQVVPLLSPIPWLRTADTQSENGDVDPLHLSSPRSTVSPQITPTSLPSTAAAGSELHLDATQPDVPSHPDTATPTGGLVDEVDPGSGGAETAEPVALSSAMSLSPERERDRKLPEGQAGAVKDEPERTASLQERFTRASSPKVEMPLDPEESKRPAEEGDDRMKE
ncbi:hypothetical protein JCM10908_005594 [Rhodotorula pacifica]|uniref:uncharacterized protein n=1 Tax=Rhodotorula pacifica TaxID=1495444 RepID=UPI00316F7DF0